MHVEPCFLKRPPRASIKPSFLDRGFTLFFSFLLMVMFSIESSVFLGLLKFFC